MASLPTTTIPSLTEATSASDSDCMLIYGLEANKIKWSTIMNLAKKELGLAAASVTNLNTLNETGIYYFSGTATGNPKEGMAGFVIHLDKPETKAQFIIGASGASYTLLWKRRYATSAWSEWSEFRPSTYDPYFVPECSNAESNASRFQRIANAIIGNVNIKTAEAATSIQFSLPLPASTGFIIRQYSFDGKVFRLTYDSTNKIWNLTREDGDITAGLWIRFPVHYMIN